MSHPVAKFKPFTSRGAGTIDRRAFRAVGENVIFEPGALAFHPENISIGDNVYVGHYAILSGYYKNEMRIGNNVWIGQGCFLHSAGGLIIEDGVGIGPGVRITTSNHRDAPDRATPITAMEVEFANVTLEAGCNIGVSTTILPGVRIGKGSQIGAGALVSSDIPQFAVAVGVPARVLRFRST